MQPSRSGQAAHAGLRPGDIIERVKGAPVKGAKHASQLLAKASKKKPLRLRNLVAALVQLQFGVRRGTYGVTNCLVLH